MHFEIQRISGRNLIPDRFMQDYLIPRVPVIIQDVVDAWPAFAEWTPETFSRNYADEAVTVGVADGTQKVMTLATFLASFIEDGDSCPYYLYDWHLPDDRTDLSSSIHIPGYFENWLTSLPEPWGGEFLWVKIGSSGARTLLHMDRWRSHSWLGLLCGKKHFTLFPPEQEALLDYGVDYYNYESAHHPLMTLAKPVTCTVNAGELMFTPSGWFHQVETSQLSIAVSGIFMNASNFHDFCLGAREGADLESNQHGERLVRLAKLLFMTSCNPADVVAAVARMEKADVEDDYADFMRSLLMAKLKSSV